MAEIDGIDGRVETPTAFNGCWLVEDRNKNTISLSPEDRVARNVSLLGVLGVYISQYLGIINMRSALILLASWLLPAQQYVLPGTCAMN